MVTTPESVIEANDESHVPDTSMNGDSPTLGELPDSSSGETSPPSRDESPRKDDADKSDKKESSEPRLKNLLMIPESGFFIKIAAPGLEPFQIPVNSLELVQELHQVLIDREETCHRTCFSLHLNGVTLDMFTELSSVEGLVPNCVVKVIEEPYTVREARMHVRHVRDLLKSASDYDSYAGNDCMSLSFLGTVVEGSNFLNNISERRRIRNETLDCTPPNHVVPGIKDIPLVPLHPGVTDTTALTGLKTITFSGWNPPPGPRRLRGDLLYLFVVTLEGKTYHITASPKGFYVNQSSDSTFNPDPGQPSYLSHSLIDLLKEISPTFKRSFAALLRKRSDKHPFERVPTPQQIYTWLAPTLPHGIDFIRAEDGFSTRLGHEEHIPGQMRDWNEEMQTAKDLPSKTTPERVLRERALFKIHSDFISAAVRGCCGVVDGNIMSINPGDNSKMQMFIWNNIFFSLGFDVKDHYKELGGDSAAHIAPALDLKGLAAVNNANISGLYTLGTAVVDYKGYRVTAQSIIPGILEKEQEQSVVYGTTDNGKTFKLSDDYLEPLKTLGNVLKVRPHKVKDELDAEHELHLSVECKGIRGNDGRNYLLDLFRVFPPDVCFMEEAFDGDAKDDPEIARLQEDIRSFGLPINHRHKLASYRPELVEAFIDMRYVSFVKFAAFHLQQFRLHNFFARKAQEEKEAKKAQAEADKDSQPEETSADQGNTAGEIVELSQVVDDENLADTQVTNAADAQLSTNSEETSYGSFAANAQKLLSVANKFADTSALDSAVVPDDRHITDVTPDNLLSQTLYQNNVLILDSADQLPISLALAKASGESDSSQLPGDMTADQSNSSEPLNDQSEGDSGDSEVMKRVGTDENSTTIEECCKSIVKKACQVVGSFSPHEYSIAFNPDIHHPHGIPADPESFEYKHERQILYHASRFLLMHQMKSLPVDILEQNIGPPQDNTTLSDLLHSRGINIRYLGIFAKMLVDTPRLSYLYNLVVSDMVTRAAKHIFRTYMQDLDPLCVSSAIAHFLNCYVGSYPNPHPQSTPLQQQKRRHKKRSPRNSNSSAFHQDHDNDWREESPRSLWKKIIEEVKDYFGFSLESESVDDFSDAYNWPKVCLLRAICKSVGIQLLLRDYNLSGRQEPSFIDDDVVGLFPISRHYLPKASDAYTCLTSGQQKFQQGQLKESILFFTEAYNLFNNVYGVMHPDTIICLRLLARINYILGDYGEALSHEQRALVMAERLLGIDAPDTITEYVNMSLYCFAVGQVATSLRLIYRARYLALLCHGENHPSIPIIDSNIGLIMHAVSQYDLSLKFLEKALELNKKFFGDTSLKAALSYHFLARAHSCRGDFRTALQHERLAFAIYQEKLGETHERTVESSECLKHLTQQAVRLQRTVNEMQKRELRRSIPPLQIQTPNMANILETLNLLNGIVIYHISAEEVEKMANAHNAASASSADGESLGLSIPEPSTADKATSPHTASPQSLDVSPPDLKNDPPISPSSPLKSNAEDITAEADSGRASAGSPDQNSHSAVAGVNEPEDMARKIIESISRHSEAVKDDATLILLDLSPDEANAKSTHYAAPDMPDIEE